MEMEMPATRFALLSPLAILAAFGILISSTGTSDARVRDHRSNSSEYYGSHCGWHRNCTNTSNSQGGVVVTTPGRHGPKIVPTKVGPPGGSFGGTVRDHRHR
jgi:hypothetical protein